jgi:hypothetical protein
VTKSPFQRKLSRVKLVDNIRYDEFCVIFVVTILAAIVKSLFRLIKISEYTFFTEIIEMCLVNFLQYQAINLKRIQNYILEKRRQMDSK